MFLKRVHNNVSDTISVNFEYVHVRSITRSQCQIKEKNCEHSRGHDYRVITMKLAQNNQRENI